MGKISNFMGKSVRVGTVFAVAGGLYAFNTYRDSDGNPERMGAQVGDDLRRDVLPRIGDTALFALNVASGLVGNGSTINDDGGDSADRHVPIPGQGWLAFLEGFGLTPDEAQKCYQDEGLEDRVLLLGIPQENPC